MDEKRIKIEYMGGCVTEKGIWLACVNNGVFFYDNKTEMILYRGKIDSLNGEKDTVIRKAVLYQDKLLLFTARNSCLFIEDSIKKGFRKLTYLGKDPFPIGDVVVKDNIAFIIPLTFEYPLIKMNMDSYNTERIDLEDFGSGKSTFTRSVREDNRIVFATRGCNNIHVCCLDISNLSLITQKINLKWINCLTIKNNELWILGRRDDSNILIEYDLIKWKTVMEVTIDEMEDLFDDPTIKYFGVYRYKGKLFFLPAYAIDIFVYDVDKKRGYRLDYPDACRSEIGICLSRFHDYEVVENMLYLFPREEGFLIKVNMDNDQLYALDCRVMLKEWKPFLEDQKSVKETETASLKVLLEVVTKDY